MNKKSVTLIITISLVFLIRINLQAAKQEPKKALSQEEASVIRTTTQKGLQGVVSAINKNYIAIEYGSDKDRNVLEASFPVDKSVTFEHKKSLADFKEGDTVYLQFEEEKEERKGKALGKRKLKVISFVRGARTVPETTELEPTQQEGE